MLQEGRYIYALGSNLGLIGLSTGRAYDVLF
jgi:hypothetical protein